jgi:hypothetical protein
MRCDAFLRADRVTEAVDSYEYMMNTIDEPAGDSCLEWSAGEYFKVLDEFEQRLTLWGL